MLAAMSATPPLPARQGGDRCPGALRLHTADDGALARVRLPGGLLTSRQTEALADAADRLGDGHLDFTSRGNVQLRGLAAACGAELGAHLREAGLLPSDRHERIRNVVASPLCGLDIRRGGAHRSAHTDVQGWARALDALLCADTNGANDTSDANDASDASDSDLSALSGRFLFGLDDGRGDIISLGPDVTLIAEEVAEGDAHHALLCFGTTGPALRLAADVAPRAAALAAAEFLAALRASGSRAWRVRELAPEQRPRTDGLARRLTAAGIACEVVADVSLPLGGAPAPGPVHGPDGRCALSVAAPLGRLTTAQWRHLARVAERDGAGELRVTPWRGVVVPGLAAEAASARLTALADAGLVTSADSPWHGAGACAGRPGCAKSLADVRADAGACLTGARPGGPGGLPVYWSGCERRCGHPAGDRWVDVLATGDGYRVTVRDTLARRAAVTVTTAELADAVAAARTTT